MRRRLQRRHVGPWARIRQVASVATGSRPLSTAALLVSLLAAFFTYQQVQAADEQVRQARQAIQAKDVNFNVTSDAAGTPRFEILNKSSVQILDVSYQFVVGDVPSSDTVEIGVLPGCTSVRLTPGAENQPRFLPRLLRFRDVNGVVWQREYGGDLIEASPDGQNFNPARTVGSPPTPIAGCT